jgi:hypothetical protein
MGRSNQENLANIAQKCSEVNMHQHFEDALLLPGPAIPSCSSRRCFFWSALAALMNLNPSTGQHLLLCRPFGQ